MAVANTGMSRAEMKKMLARSKDGPVSCAVGQGDDAALGLLIMHNTKSPKAMEKTLKDDFPDVKNPRFGTAFVDVADNPKLVKFQLNRAVSGMARRLVKTLKGTGYNKVILLGEDGSLIEEHEEADEEAEAGEAVASAPEAPVAPPPPPPQAPPAAVKSPEEVAAQTAALQKVLATLAPMIPKAAGDDAARKAELMKLATDANVNIKTGNLVNAADFLDQLKRALQGTAAPAVSPPAGLRELAASRLAWTGVQDTVKAEVDKLRRELAKTYQGQPFAGEIEAKFLAKVAPVTTQFDDRLLDVLDDLMNTEDPAARQGLVTQARGLIKTYLSFAMADPFIGELDANPFVKLSIRPTVTSTLANLAKTLH